MRFKGYFLPSYSTVFRDDRIFYKISPDDSKKIQAIREVILFEAKEDPKSFALEDVERLETDDIFLFRFLNQQDGHMEAALKVLRKSLKWRKESKVNSLGLMEVAIPREIADLRPFHCYTKDKHGIPTIYTRSLPIPPKKFRPLIIETVIFFGERVTAKVSQHGRRFGFINDCRDMVFDKAMLDIEFFKEMTKLRDINYPDLYAYIALYEFPPSLKWLYKLFSPLIPKKTKEKIIFLDKDNIDEIIGLDNVPDYMGGRCQEPYMLDTSSFPNLDDLAVKHGFTKDDVAEVYRIYGDYLLKNSDELFKEKTKLIKLEELEDYFD